MTSDLASREFWPHTHAYRPIDNDKKQIRLLRLHYKDRSDGSSDRNAPISGELQHASLDDNPSYTALSYVWGDRFSTIPIILDGSYFHVTQNLFKALCLLESRAQGLYFWIDAVCIDQRNDDEKNEQVQQMDRIYHNASNVFVWLNLHASVSRETMRYFNSLSSMWVKGLQSESEARAEEGDGPQGPEVLAIISMGMDENPLDLDTFCRVLAHCDWFNRIWCVQEVIVARKAVLWDGYHTLDWVHVTNAIMACGMIAKYAGSRLTRETAVMLGASYVRLAHLNFLFQKFHEGEETGVSLLEILDRVRLANLSATDPRDRVYGLLAMASGEDRQQITVNYGPSSTLKTVLFDTAKSLISRHGANVLQYCHPSPLRKELPSWVPDWTYPTGGHLDVSFLDECVCEASIGREGEPIELCSVNYTNPVLRLKGIMCGKVRRHGVTLDNSSFSMQEWTFSVSDCCRWLSMTKSLIELDTEPDTADSVSLEDAKANLWRLPITNQRLGELEAWEDKLFEEYQILTGGISPAADFSPDEARIWVEDHTRNYRRLWKIYSSVPFVTDHAVIGLGPRGMRSDDLVCVFPGCQMPMVIRKEENQDRYTIVGAAWVYNYMEGQAVRGNPQMQTIELI